MNMEQFYFLHFPLQKPNKLTINNILQFSRSIEIVKTSKLQAITLHKN